MVIGQTYNRPPNLPEFDYKKWHFGFTLGPEFQNFKISNNSENIIGQTNFTTPKPDKGTVSKVCYYSDVPAISTGFHVGIITSRRLGECFNLRMIPSLSLGQRTVESKMYVEETLSSGTTYTYYDEDDIVSTSIKSTYLSLPVLIKYKAVRIENARPYIIAGASLKYDLSIDFEDPITLRKMNYYLELGLGSDFYMQTFRLGIEVRFSIGLRDILDTNRPVDDAAPYITASIDGIKSKMFSIAFNFE